MHASRLVLVARSSVNSSTHRRRRPIQGRRPMSPSALSPVRPFLLLAAVGTLALAPTALAAKPTGGSGGTGGGGGGKTDRTAPTVSIGNPASGATASGRITASGPASDNAAVASVAVSVDGGAYSPASGTTSWSSSLDTTTLTNGSHTLTARASDAAGNTGMSSVTFSVSNNAADTTAPTVAIAHPVMGAGVARQFAVDGPAADNASVSKVEVRFDSGAYTPATGTSSWSTTIDASTAADGQHTVTARATDAAGNTSTSSVTVAIGSSGTAVQAPAMAPGTIGGFIFKETDRDGVFETTETALTSQNIYLYDSAGQFVANTYSDANGWFQFAGQPAGSYQVRLAQQPYIDLRSDWVPDTTGSLLPRVNLTLGTNSTARADLGWRPIVRSTDAAAPISTYVGPNGLTVKSYDDVISARDVYDRLMTGSLVGREASFVTIRFDYVTAGVTTSHTMSSNGVYTDFGATSNITWLGWLTGDNELFHEYGHAWSLYYAYIVQQDPTMTAYLKARGLYGDSRVGSSYGWDTREMIAEDYRQLFGNANAQSFAQMNRDIPPASQVPGLRDFLANTFTQPPR